jgi:ligand-binding sensor domain-containing protein/signal transduction histidine kinase
MKDKKPGLIFIAILFIIGGTALPAQQVNLKHYSVQDGISQSEIKCIFQDSEGFMWFGTQNGLNKFDGYTFTRYFTDPSDSTTISNGWIYGMAEDSSGCLWIATKRGLNRFDKKTGHFSKFSHRLPGSIVNDDFIYGLAADNSSIYINTPPELSILDTKTGKIESFNNGLEYEGILYDIGYPIIRSRGGLLWIGSSNGLSCFDIKEKKFRVFLHDEKNPATISDDRITALYEDKAGNILIGTAHGFNIYNPGTKAFSHYFHNDYDPQSLSSSFIRSIVQDRSGAVWIGTEDKGLNKVFFNSRGEASDFMHYRSIPDSRGYISHDIVYSLYHDRSNNLWIGTIAGIDKLDLKKKKFSHYKKTDNPASVDLLDNVIGSIHKDINGSLWIGNWNKGLNIYNRGTGRVLHYTATTKGRLRLPGNNVHVIFRDSRSGIWIGTRNGVCIYDRKTSAFIPLRHYFGIEDAGYFDDNRVYCIIEDHNGRIWIGTANGIFMMDPHSKQVTIIQSSSGKRLSISNNLVYSLLEDRDNNIWIATSNGLDRYVPGEDRICHYLRSNNSPNTLCDNYTISLCMDYQGDIWIGTSTGVSRFNKKDSVFSCYTMKDGLPSNIIYDIIEDNRHDLWFTTGNGLARFSAVTKNIRPYTLEEGVQGMEFNIKAVFKGEDGELFFGGMDGFISFFPDSLKDNDYMPPVKITSFEKENNGIRSQQGVYDDPIRLTYHDYSFTIEFSALDFSDPLKNQYAYQLQPLSDKWIDIGNRRFVHFTKLPPGHYTFRVRGTNNDGFWSPSVASINVVIVPPWWKSNYAFAGYVLAGILLIFFFIRWRITQLIKEKKILEQKISERTDEILSQKDKLHELNSTKDKFFSILAHDLKGPFSSLYSMSELLIRNYETMEESDKHAGLVKINKQAELIYQLLENLLTWSRTQRGGMVFSPVRFNLAKLIETNVNLHRTIAGEKRIKVINRNEADHFAYGDTEMIHTVVRNLISNAVKFTALGNTVDVDVVEQPEWLEVLVKDQGVGISPENLQKLFRIDVKYKTTGTAGETGTGLGLVLCREFVEKNGGKIWCESRENSGSIFHFTLPRYTAEND